MKYRALDEKEDYSFGTNKFYTKVEAVAQAILTRMRLLYGEWWENTEDGLPLFEKILGTFGGAENKNAVDLIISERILGTEGVTEIISFESTFLNRIYSAQCVVNTVYGQATLFISENAKAVEVKY